MKIIAKTHKGFIVETTKEDMRNLKGFFGCETNADKRPYLEPEIGESIEACKLYRSIRSARTYNNITKIAIKSLEKRVKQLKQIIDPSFCDI